MEIVYLAQNKNPLSIYALVTQYLFSILVLTIGGYLLGKYVIFKDSIAAGIFATVGAISGIVLFVLEMIRLGKNEKK